MRRPALLLARWGLATAALLVYGCSSTPPPVSSHDLERPTDISFVCLRGVPPGADAGAADGGADADDGGGAAPAPMQVSGRPMSECHPPLQFDPIPVDVTHRTFGFVTNTARGELAVIDMDASKLVDLDPATPEINLVPLGVLSEQMSASQDGCRLVTANRGSCDLTLVDPAAVMTPLLAAEAKLPPPLVPAASVTDTVVVHGSSGAPLHLAPQEILFLPQNTAAMTDDQNLCPVAFDTSGPAPWRALVSFPSCDLVALIDLPSGQIVDSMFIHPDGSNIKFESGGSNPSCPYTDCGAGTRPPPDDPNAPISDPFVSTTAVRPGPLAILPDGSRAYVGLASAAYVAAIGISSSGQLSAGGSILLHDNDNGGSALGSDRVRLSVDPYQKTGVPGVFGRFVGEGVDRTRQYLYVFAHDGTVRVIDVSPAARQEPETECDTNLDPRNIPPNQRTATTTCAPVVNPPVNRKPEAIGPGISVPGIAVDATFADLTIADAFSDREQVLDGSFGFILTTGGPTFIVNIDPTLRTTTLVNGVLQAATPPEVQPLVNSLRNHNQISFIATLDPTSGPPRLALAPVPPAAGPQIEGILVTDPNDNTTITSTTPLPLATYVFFPQVTQTTMDPVTKETMTQTFLVPDDVTAQTWNLTWEGDLSGTSFSGQVVQPQASDTGLATFHDVGADFCQQGALNHDILNLTGCTVDAQCGPLQVCRLSETAPPMALSLPINGICVPVDSAAQDAELNNPLCIELQNTVKRYEIVSATPSLLTLRPKIDEIPTIEIPTTTLTPDGCSSDVDCQPADDPSRAAFSCRQEDHRCVQVCTPSGVGVPMGDGGLPLTSPCRLGRVCAQFFDGPDSVHGFFCADAPNLSAELVNSCGLNQLIAYQIQAGSSFVVQGTAPSPPIPRGVTPDGSTCQDGGRNPLLVNRIPLTRATLPVCTNVPNFDATTDPAAEQALLLQIAHTTPAPDPCRFEGGPTATDPPSSGLSHMRVLFQNSQVRFILTNVDQYTNDIAPIQFTVQGGFLPDTVVIPSDIDIDMATRIVVSPLDSQTQLFDMSATHEIPYLFVVDQRRLGRVTAGVGPTRGQVLRIDPRMANSDQSTFLPTYQDPSTTADLWPIQ